MRHKADLFHLVQSMTKAEKRHFTIEAKKSGRKNNRYLELFQLINKQEVYDETPLKQQFGRKLGDDKARLYEVLMKSLRDYQRRRSFKVRIRELLADSKILFERKLFSQAENRLAEAKELALELEDQLSILEINLRQRQLLRELRYKNYGELIDDLVQEKEANLRQLVKEFGFHDDYDRLSVDYLRNPSKRSEETFEEFQKTYANTLAGVDAASSFVTNWRYHRFMILYCRLTGEPAEMLKHAESIIALWEAKPKIKSEDFAVFLVDYFNLVSTISRDPSRFAEFKEHLDRLDAIEPPTSRAQQTLFERISIYRLLYLINSKETKILPALNGIEQGLKQYDLVPSSELVILFNASILAFANDRYEYCQVWLDQIVNLCRRFKGLRRDILHSSRLMLLLCDYSLDDFDQIERRLRRSMLYLKEIEKSKLKNAFELTVKTVKALQMGLTPQKEKEALKEALQQIDADKTQISLGMGELISWWLNSQLQKKPINVIR